MNLKICSFFSFLFSLLATIANHIYDIYVNIYISTLGNQVFNVFGFIKRCSKQFEDPHWKKTLYTSLVHSIRSSQF